MYSKHISTKKTIILPLTLSFLLPLSCGQLCQRIDTNPDTRDRVIEPLKPDIRKPGQNVPNVDVISTANFDQAIRDLNSKDFGAAKNKLKAVHRGSKYYSDSRQILGYLAEKERSLTEAETYYKEALKEKDESRSILESLARVKIKMRKYSEACRYYERSEEISNKKSAKGRKEISEAIKREEIIKSSDRKEAFVITDEELKKENLIELLQILENKNIDDNLRAKCGIRAVNLALDQNKNATAEEAIKTLTTLKVTDKVLAGKIKSIKNVYEKYYGNSIMDQVKANTVQTFIKIIPYAIVFVFGGTIILVLLMLGKKKWVTKILDFILEKKLNLPKIEQIKKMFGIKDNSKDKIKKKKLGSK